MEEIYELKADTTSKKFMFNLGRLFACGYKIKLTNEKEVLAKIEKEKELGYAKSFNMMLKYWQDNNLAPNVFEKQKKENGLFLICPVRNATEKEKENLTNTIEEYENKGYDVHYPERDTNQDPYVSGENTGGYNICLQNASAIAASKTVAIYYNRKHRQYV